MDNFGPVTDARHVHPNRNRPTYGATQSQVNPNGISFNPFEIW